MVFGWCEAWIRFEIGDESLSFNYVPNPSLLSCLFSFRLLFCPLVIRGSRREQFDRSDNTQETDHPKKSLYCRSLEIKAQAFKL